MEGLAITPEKHSRQHQRAGYFEENSFWINDCSDTRRAVDLTISSALFQAVERPVLYVAVSVLGVGTGSGHLSSPRSPSLSSTQCFSRWEKPTLRKQPCTLDKPVLSATGVIASP